MTRMNYDRHRKVFVRDRPEDAEHEARVAAILAADQQPTQSTTGPWYFATVQERESWLQSRKRR